MNGLPNELLEELKVKLRAERQTVQERITELNSQDPFGDPDRLNDNAATDREASEEDGHDRVQALLTELAEKKTAIDAALVRMAGGTPRVQGRYYTQVGIT